MVIVVFVLVWNVVVLFGVLLLLVVYDCLVCFAWVVCLVLFGLMFARMLLFDWFILCYGVGSLCFVLLVLCLCVGLLVRVCGFVVIRLLRLFCYLLVIVLLFYLVYCYVVVVWFVLALRLGFACFKCLLGGVAWYDCVV